MIENPLTGEQIEFVEEAPDVLVMESVWTRPGHRAPEHIHPKMQERFEIVAGRAAFEVDGQRLNARPGDVVVVSPGQRHVAWNSTDGEVRLRIEMSPPLRWREFTTRLFSGEDPASLLREFGDEVVLPPRQR